MTQLIINPVLTVAGAQAEIERIFPNSKVDVDTDTANGNIDGSYIFYVESKERYNYTILYHATEVNIDSRWGVYRFDDYDEIQIYQCGYNSLWKTRQQADAEFEYVNNQVKGL